MLDIKILNEYLNNFLSIQSFSDYSPNGLQIEGAVKVKKIAFAVSATRASIEEAVRIKADTLIVHHGLFWKFHGAKTLTGPFYKRVAPLIKNNINLIAHHLPLDAHLEVGNAAVIASKLNLSRVQPFGDHKGMPTGVKGIFSPPVSPKDLKEKLRLFLHHEVLHSCPSEKLITSIGVITGGANSEWRRCIEDNLDAYLTGEISEHDWHEAQESNIHFFAGGHNATEQFGIQTLMLHLQKKFASEHINFVYISSENPA